MILQALNSYYRRLLDDPNQDVAEPGFSKEKIHFELVLSKDGKLLAANNIQTVNGKKLAPRLTRVPEPAKDRRGLKIVAQFMWDNTGYALGSDKKGDPDRALNQFSIFRDFQKQVLGGVDDDGSRAVLGFLESWHPDRVQEIPNWNELVGFNIVFRLNGESGFIHDRAKMQNAWLNHLAKSKSGERGFCLVTNLQSIISRTHIPIKGLYNQKNIGPLVGFNKPAYESYGKEQSYNAPVSEQAAFAYATALNHMLSADSRQRVQVGDATTVFWSEKPTKVEEFFAAALGGAVDEESTDAHDSNLLADLRNLLDSLREGGRAPTWDVDPQTPFYILGLSPNAARISVRFWHVATVEGIMRRLAEHYQDLEIESRYENEPKYPGIFKLLLETVPVRRKADGRAERKADDIQPLLGGELMRAILTGGEYPRSLLSKIIGRFRADGEVTYLRAALLKAHFSRLARLGKPSKEVSVSLDPNSNDIGYRLGRLFAVLEKAQQDALPGINATIKDRFYGAASATPKAVLPLLISRGQHNISKLKRESPAFAKAAESRLLEIMSGIAYIPAHQSLDGQAMFALGYYHQRNEFFRKKNNQSGESTK